MRTYMVLSDSTSRELCRSPADICIHAHKDSELKYQACLLQYYMYYN